MRTFPAITVAFTFLIQGCGAGNPAPVSNARPASAGSAQTDCREIQEPTGPVLECPAFDLIVSSGEVLPLATLSNLLSKAGLTITESVLTIGGSPHPALRLEKPRSDGGIQIGWATIVPVNGTERNVTCYLRPHYTEERYCVEGLSQLSRGKLRISHGHDNE
jgi:hypothetical protein